LPPGVPASILEESKARETDVEGKSNGKGNAKEVVIESNQSDYIDIDSE
jgi:hypothetical protein